MAKILIAPVTASSKGLYKVIIDGVDPTGGDCLKGSITSPNAGKIDGAWDLGGIMRNGSDDCNIDPYDDNVKDVMDLARKLGAE